MSMRNVQTRWYPGAGIYRKVRLVVAEPVHIGWNGLWVRTTPGDDGKAGASIAVAMENGTTNPAPVKVEIVLSSPEGRAAGRAVCEGVIPGGDSTNLEARIEVADPEPWDIDTPRLYRATATVIQDGRTADERSTGFGFRTARFDAAQGFILNGRRVAIKGVCLHHDLGPLGAVFHPRAMERQLELLKEMGCNAIRTSHNIPAAEVLDLCDRMGLLVCAEAFDKWSSDRSFAAYADRQIRNFVVRDRNHPCVIVRGAGNELAQQRERGITVVGRKVAGSFKRYDPDRPAKLRLAADRTVMKTDGDDLIFVTVEVLDKDGNLCPNASDLVRYALAIWHQTEHAGYWRAPSLRGISTVSWPGRSVRMITWEPSSPDDERRPSI